MERILAMVDPALFQLSILVEEAETDAVKLAAIRDVLDRAGYGAKQTLQLTGEGGGPIQLTQVRTQLEAAVAKLPEDMRLAIAERMMLDGE